MSKELCSPGRLVRGYAKRDAGAVVSRLDSHHLHAPPLRPGAGRARRPPLHQQRLTVVILIT